MSIYLKIPGVQGNVTAKGYEGCIELHGFSSDSIRPVSQEVGRMQDRCVGKMRFSKLTITKKMDQSTIKLLAKLYDGRTFDEVTLFQCTTSDAPECFAKTVYSEVLVSRYQEFSASQGAHETFELSYAKQEKSFTMRDSQNQLRSPEYIGYNLETAEHF